MDRILRNNAMQGISYESVIDYTLDFLELTGVPGFYEEKYYDGEIKQYRCALPCDFVKENQILLKDHKRNKNRFEPARYTTDTFKNYHCAEIEPRTDYTYNINRNFIFTSVEDGLLKMSYRAIATDDEGYPLMPDDRHFMLALEWYIRVQYFTMAWEDGRIEDKRLQHAEQEYAWAVGRYTTHSQLTSLGEMESFLNSFKQLIPRENEFAKRFTNSGSKEILRVQ